MTSSQKGLLLVLAGLVIILALYLGVDLAALGRAVQWVLALMG